MRSFAMRCCAAFGASITMCSVCPGLTYQIDDGTVELILSPGNGAAMAWMNSFQVQSGGETLVSINIETSGLVVSPMTVHIWTDPTNDGNPVDAVGVRSAATSSGIGTVTVPITPLTLPVGDWFFAGAFYATPIDASLSPHAAEIDTTDPSFPNRSYLASWLNSASADPNHPSMGTDSFGPETQGNYVVRVNAVPEPAGFALVVVGAICLKARRRSRRANLC